MEIRLLWKPTIGNMPFKDRLYNKITYMYKEEGFQMIGYLGVFPLLLGTQLTTFLASCAVSGSLWLSSRQWTVGRSDVHSFQAWPGPMKPPIKSSYSLFPHLLAGCRKCSGELLDPREEQPLHRRSLRSLNGWVEHSPNHWSTPAMYPEEESQPLEW